MDKIAVIGAGSWGTTLANLLAGKGNVQVHLWVREGELLELMRTQGRNEWFLPDFPLQPGLQLSSDLGEVLHGAAFTVMVVPCQFLRQVLAEAKAHLPERPAVVCASKGIEVSRLKTMSQVVQEELGDMQPRYFILSGPSFAKEVSRGLPTAVTLGGSDREMGQRIQERFSQDHFRVYLNADYKGVELGGALKNVMALAAGVSDGLGFGSDARAALITRGLAEMSRLGVAMGAEAKTFMGLSGLGDLVLTCTGDLSRNRQVGLKLGQGYSLTEILEGMNMVAEGVKTTEAVYQLSTNLGVEMPITEQVYAMLYQGKHPGDSVKELMRRELKEE